MKLVLLSVVVATLLLPAIAARERNPVRGLKRALAAALGFLVLYGAWLLVVTPRF